MRKRDVPAGRAAGSSLTRRVCALFAGLCLAAPDGARSAPRPLFPAEQEYLIRAWETPDGLPENSATALAQTSDGYLWFGTFDGLVRFDGVMMRVFDERTTPALPSGSILNVYRSCDDRLWINTDRGMAMLENGVWHRYGTNEGWTAVHVRRFAESLDGRLVCATADGQLLEFSGDRFEPVSPPPPGVAGRGFGAAVFEHSGALWIHQAPSPPLCLRGNRWTTPTSALVPEESSFVGMGASRDGGAWLLAPSRLVKLRDGRVTEARPLARRDWGFWSLYEDSRSNVWVTSYAYGLFRISPSGETRRFFMDNGLTINNSREVWEDAHGVLWVGTSGGGLLSYAPRRIQAIGVAEGLKHSIVRSVHPSGPASVLVGTHGGGVAEVGPDGIRQIRISPEGSDPTQDTYLQAVLEDRRGWRWYGGYRSGLILERPGSPSLQRLTGAEKLDVHVLFEDRDGAVWIGAETGVAKHDGTLWRWLGPAEGLPRKRVRAITQNPKDGTVWVAMDGEPIYRSTGNRFEVEPRLPAAVGQDARALHGSEDGTLWIGTGRNGLVTLRGGRVAVVNPEAGLSINLIAAMVEDGLGALWMTSNRGLARLEIADVDAWLAGRSARVHPRMFGMEDGLPSESSVMGSQPAACRGADGRLWFGTVRGLAVVDPRELSERPPAHPTIERVVADGVVRFDNAATTVPTAPIVLPRGTRRVEIGYTSVDLAGTSRTTFDTWLEGGESGWVTVGPQRVALWRELPPGAYRFHVRAVGRGGEVSDRTAVVAFQLLPFWWQTTGFRVLEWLMAAAAAGGIITWGTNRRMRRRLEQLEQQAALAAIQGRLTDVLENTPDLVGFSGLDRKPIYLNPAGRRLLGLAPDADLTQFTTADMYTPSSDEGVLREALPTAVRTGLWRGENTLRTRDGREVPVSQVIIAHRRPDGSPDYISTIARDITALKESERALLASERRFRSLVEACPMGLHTYEVTPDERLVFTGYNPAADRILGLDHQSFVGKTIEEAFPPLVATEVPAAYRRAALEGIPWSTQFLEYQHGQVRGAFDVYAFQTGPRQAAVMFLEVTVRKQAELALRDSEERFRQLAGAVTEGFWLADWPERRMLYVNPGFEALWGLPAQRLYTDPNICETLLQGQDPDRTGGAEAEPVDGRTEIGEIRVRRPDGSVRWAQGRVFPVRNETGAVYRIAGVVQDVTDQRQADLVRQAVNRIALAGTGLLTPHGVGQSLAAETRTLFQHDTFVFGLRASETGLFSGIYAEETPDDAGAPGEVPCGALRLGPRVAEALERQEAFAIRLDEEGTPPPLSGWQSTSPSASRSLLLAPLLRQRQTVGLIAILSRSAARYDDRDAERLQLLANQCAAAVQRAQAEEDLARLNEALEAKVRERTDDFQRIATLMAGREVRMAELKEELARLRAQLRQPDPAADLPPPPSGGS